MTAPVSGTPRTTTTSTPAASYPRAGLTRRLNTVETKPAFKTTEMVFYIAAVIGVLIATQVVDGFSAAQGWFYVTLLTMGYMLSRGLAKAGSYQFDTDPRDMQDDSIDLR
jgi:hypothetical protein